MGRHTFVDTFCLFLPQPLRKFYILKQHLVFPSPTATAYTIRSIHAKGGEVVAKKKTRALLISFFGALTFVVVNQYASGILMDWHIFYWLYSWGWKSALAGENWGWIIELTPAFFGAGMLAGMNASYSFLAGIILMYGVIGPALIQTGEAKGKILQELDGPINYVSYFGTGIPDNLKDASKILGSLRWNIHDVVLVFRRARCQWTCHLPWFQERCFGGLRCRSSPTSPQVRGRDRGPSQTVSSSHRL